MGKSTYLFTDRGIKKLERIAALLELEDADKAVSVSVHLAALYAEAYVKGKTEFVFCTPELKSSIENNPEFFEALCQEGAIEWLTPFVLGKSTTPPEENQ
jgi:hypothetical protein